MKTKETIIGFILSISLMLTVVKNAELGWCFYYTMDMEQQRSELIDMTRRALVQQKVGYMALQAEIEALKAPCDRMEFVIKPEDMR